MLGLGEREGGRKGEGDASEGRHVVGVGRGSVRVLGVDGVSAAAEIGFGF